MPALKLDDPSLFSEPYIDDVLVTYYSITSLSLHVNGGRTYIPGVCLCLSDICTVKMLRISVTAYNLGRSEKLEKRRQVGTNLACVVREMFRRRHGYRQS